MATTTHNKRPHLFTEAIATQNAGIEAALRESIYRSARMFDRVRDAFARRRAANAAFRELSELNDRELADLGIGRGDIRAVVNGTYARRD